jgi:hypothetical protein
MVPIHDHRIVTRHAGDELAGAQLDAQRPTFHVKHVASSRWEPFHVKHAGGRASRE